MLPSWFILSFNVKLIVSTFRDKITNKAELLILTNKILDEIIFLIISNDVGVYLSGINVLENKKNCYLYNLIVVT